MRFDLASRHQEVNGVSSEQNPDPFQSGRYEYVYAGISNVDNVENLHSNERVALYFCKGWPESVCLVPFGSSLILMLYADYNSSSAETSVIQLRGAVSNAQLRRPEAIVAAEQDIAGLSGTARPFASLQEARDTVRA